MLVGPVLFPQSSAKPLTFIAGLEFKICTIFTVSSEQSISFDSLDLEISSPDNRATFEYCIKIENFRKTASAESSKGSQELIYYYYYYY